MNNIFFDLSKKMIIIKQEQKLKVVLETRPFEFFTTTNMCTHISD